MLVAVQAIDGKGQGLVATRDLEPGSVILHHESPLILFPICAVRVPADGCRGGGGVTVEDVDSLLAMRSCAHCLRHLLLPTTTTTTTRPIPVRVASALQALQNTGVCQPPISCPRACGALFCSTACRAAAELQYHGRLCRRASASAAAVAMAWAGQTRLCLVARMMATARAAQPGKGKGSRRLKGEGREAAAMTGVDAQAHSLPLAQEGKDGPEEGTEGVGTRTTTSRTVCSAAAAAKTAAAAAAAEAAAGDSAPAPVAANATSTYAANYLSSLCADVGDPFASFDSGHPSTLRDMRDAILSAGAAAAAAAATAATATATATTTTTAATGATALLT